MSGKQWRGARRARIGLAVAVLLALPLAGAGVARGAASESYSLNGYEIWFTPTVGTFVGTGRGTGGELAGWSSVIEHSLVVSPSGTITGGWATLYRLDGVRISGQFIGGTLRLTNDGPGCTNESHAVTGRLARISRSDSASVGIGVFRATLVHYRTWLFGRCLTYSASVGGEISLYF
jgi:hypothetical protein